MRPVANPAIRNIAIVAHVDTEDTLVDALLHQSGISANERVASAPWDNTDLERERGSHPGEDTAVTHKDT